MQGTNAKTIETLERERERESLNIKDIGFINIAKKLYIKYKELKINKRKAEYRSQRTEVRYLVNDSASVKKNNKTQQNVITKLVGACIARPYIEETAKKCKKKETMKK